MKDAFKVDKPDLPLRAAAGNEGAGYNTAGLNAKQYIGLIVKMALSLMGVLFLALAIYAGYTWMTARGNEEAVEKAKNTLTNAVIGIVVVMAAYAISYYFIDVLSGATLGAAK